MAGAGAARCRSTSIRSTRRSTIPRSARAWCARSSAAFRSRPASCCRCSAGTRAAQRGWRSERWPLRRGKLFLVPGDSPVGLRLPMKTPALRAGRRTFPYIHRAGPAGAARPAARRRCAFRQSVARRRRSRQQTQMRAVRGRRRGAHRADRRAARRRALRLHAADRRRSRTISNCSATVEAIARGAQACRCASRAIRRPTIRASTSSR